MIEAAVSGHILNRAIEAVSADMAEDGSQHIDLNLLYLRSIMLLMQEQVQHNVDTLECPDEEEIAGLSQSIPYQVRRGGRKHLNILTPVAMTINIFTAVGTWPLALKAGWTAVDPPEGSSITIAAGGPVAQPVIVHIGADARNVNS